SVSLPSARLRGLESWNAWTSLTHDRSTARGAPCVDDGPQPHGEERAQWSEEGESRLIECEWIAGRGSAGGPAEQQSGAKAHRARSGLRVVERAETGKEPRETQCR